MRKTMDLLHYLIFVHSRWDEVLESNYFCHVLVNYFIGYQLDAFEGSFSDQYKSYLNLLRPVYLSEMLQQEWANFMILLTKYPRSILNRFFLCLSFFPAFFSSFFSSQSECWAIISSFSRFSSYYSISDLTVLHKKYVSRG